MAGNYSKLALEAKMELEQFVVEIKPKLEEYFDFELGKVEKLDGKLAEVSGEIVRHAKEYLLRPQKRLRPSMVMCGYKLGGGEKDERIWRAAMAVEVVHAALLMHDDFADLDDLRRGGKSTHKYFEDYMQGGVHFGEAMAVNAGDVLLNMGYELLMESGFEAEKVVKVGRHLFGTIARTALGQGLDICLPFFANWGEKDVIEVHKTKTAIYTYRNPLFIGAYLAGVDEKVISILDEYAMNAGVAFQLQDDILGVFGDSEKTGKSDNSDILQGKCTLLVDWVFKNGTEEQKQILGKVWGKKEIEGVEEAKKVIRESGAWEHSRDMARRYAKKAAGICEELRKLSLDKEAIDYLQGIAEYMVEREV